MAFMQVILFALFALTLANDAEEKKQLADLATKLSHDFHSVFTTQNQENARNSVENSVENFAKIQSMQSPGLNRRPGLDIRALLTLSGGTVLVVKRGEHQVSVTTELGVLAASGVNITANATQNQENAKKISSELHKLAQPLMVNQAKNLDKNSTSNDIRVGLINTDQKVLQVKVSNFTLEANIGQFVAAQSRTRVQVH